MISSEMADQLSALDEITKTDSPYQHTRIQKRGAREFLMTAFGGASAALTLTAGAAILSTLTYKGLPQLSLDTFIKSIPAQGSEGGLANAIVGSIIISSASVSLGWVIGVAAALDRSEFAPDSRLTRYCRFMVEGMSFLPSLFWGLEAYSFIDLPFHGFYAVAGIAALTPIATAFITTAAENYFKQISKEFRLAGHALGASRSQVIRYILYPMAKNAIKTATYLALARVAAETAPALFSMLGNLNFSLSLFKPMETLSLAINYLAGSSDASQVALAYTGGLLLSSTIIGAMAIARIRGLRPQNSNSVSARAILSRSVRTSTLITAGAIAGLTQAFFNKDRLRQTSLLVALGAAAAITVLRRRYQSPKVQMSGLRHKLVSSVKLASSVMLKKIKSATKSDNVDLYVENRVSSEREELRVVGRSGVLSTEMKSANLG